ncbi:MAG: hypothetical protein IJL52_08945 [Clostridia bacterium]|nr:hypothetical protein [Clostridia bacterium]
MLQNKACQTKAPTFPKRVGRRFFAVKLRCKTKPYGDTINGACGFSTNTTEFSADKAKHTPGTDYAKWQGLSVNDRGNSGWWLRSPGRASGSAEAVSADGVISHSSKVNPVSEGARPHLRGVALAIFFDLCYTDK